MRGGYAGTAERAGAGGLCCRCSGVVQGEEEKDTKRQQRKSCSYTMIHLLLISLSTVSFPFYPGMERGKLELSIVTLVQKF